MGLESLTKCLLNRRGPLSLSCFVPCNLSLSLTQSLSLSLSPTHSITSLPPPLISNQRDGLEVPRAAEYEWVQLASLDYCNKLACAQHTKAMWTHRQKTACQHTCFFFFEQSPYILHMKTNMLRKLIIDSSDRMPIASSGRHLQTRPLFQLCHMYSRHIRVCLCLCVWQGYIYSCHMLPVITARHCGSSSSL